MHLTLVQVELPALPDFASLASGEEYLLSMVDERGNKFIQINSAVRIIKDVLSSSWTKKVHGINHMKFDTCTLSTNLPSLLFCEYLQDSQLAWVSLEAFVCQKKLRI